MSRSIIDISPPLTPSTAVFPGDTPLSREEILHLRHGHSVTLATMRATVHLGAHADAPSHYGLEGRTIDAQPLERYLGRCQVLAPACAPRERIRPEDLGAEIRAPRVLLRTGTFPDPERWSGDFAALSVELVDFLHARGVLLVGVDTPSVDIADSKELPAHKRILAHDMAILEGLLLGHVQPGDYELVALPLRLVGFDASPVRAVLLPLG